MTRSIYISRLAQNSVRNLVSDQIHFSPKLNLLVGNNGQGKTSVLEALALAATGRSFRTDQAREVIRHGAASASSVIDVIDSSTLRRQRVDVIGGRKQILVDNARAARIQDFAVLTPIVVFHPADLELISGPAALRRTLLARVSLYVEPYHFDSHRSYTLALRERQRLLTDRGPSAPGLDAFEQVAAKHGAVVSGCNARAAEHITVALEQILDQIAPNSLNVSVRHAANGSTDPAEFDVRLKETRSRDQHRGRPTYGPQRDDLQIFVDAADARRHASQGQQRLLALALKLAELATIRTARQVHPVLLLDDVASELDPDRTSILLNWLCSCESQVFITTARWEPLEVLIHPDSDHAFLRLRGGVAERLEAFPKTV